MIRMIAIAGITLLGVWFFWDNRLLLAYEIPVVLRLPFIEVRPLPPQGPSVSAMLLVTFFSGFILAYVLGLYRRMQSAMKVRRLKKQLKQHGIAIDEKTAIVKSPTPRPSSTALPNEEDDSTGA